MRCTRRTPRRAGVTLVELLVSICVIVALVALTFLMFSSAQQFADRMDSQLAKVDHKLAKKRAVRRHNGPNLVPNQYVVRFNGSVTNPQAAATQLAANVPAQVLHVYTNVFRGAAVRIQPGDLDALKADPSVASVSQAHYVYAMN